MQRFIIHHDADALACLRIPDFRPLDLVTFLLKQKCLRQQLDSIARPYSTVLVGLAFLVVNWYDGAVATVLDKVYSCCQPKAW